MTVGWRTKSESSPEPDDPPASPWEDGSERERIVAWRRHNLEKAGLPYPLALQIAISDANWHRVDRALKNGATVELVERIFL